jgi:alkylhydroperoxidase family enzyme
MQWASVISNPETADVDLRMRPVLDLVRKLTLSPGKITAADIDPIFAAGWNDRALHDATAICGLFNLMNRLVNGLGVEASESYAKMAAQRLADGGYAGLLKFLPAPKQELE